MKFQFARLSCMVAFLLPIYGQIPGQSNEVLTPVNAKPEPKTPQERRLRDARNRLYSTTRGKVRVGSSAATDARRMTVVEVGDMPELPVEMSDLVAIGLVQDRQPYLSSDGESVYTEYTVSVTQVLKQCPKCMPTLDGRIAIGLLGGAIRLENGRTVTHYVKGRGIPPQVGKQYILFLTYTPDANLYQLVKLWGVEGNSLAAMSEDDLLRVYRGRSTTSGLPPSSVLDSIRLLVQNGRNSQK